MNSVNPDLHSSNTTCISLFENSYKNLIYYQGDDLFKQRDKEAQLIELSENIEYSTVQGLDEFLCSDVRSNLRTSKYFELKCCFYYDIFTMSVVSVIDCSNSEQRHCK